MAFLNVRKFICKNLAKKGTWLYRASDCQRYEPKPPIIEPPIIEPPKPPEIKKCQIPYYETGKLLCFSGNMLCTLSTKDNATFKEADLPRYFDFLVSKGINSFRSFSAFYDGSPEWDSWRPDRDGDVYYEHLRRRLEWAKERRLTTILSLMPYAGAYDDEILCQIIYETWPLYDIVYEPWNENGNLATQARIVNMLKDSSIHNKYIQLYFEDSGDWVRYLQANPGMISTQHGVGSMKTVDYWWRGSPGCRELMKLGFYAGDDGGDMEKDAHGPMFYSNSESRRPDNGQLYEITKFMLQNTTGFDHLSAAAFANGETVPDLEKEMANGVGEMEAMNHAWHDVFGDHD